MSFDYDNARAMAEDDNSVMVPDIELTLALDEIDRLRAELVVARAAMQGWTDCANGLRAELALERANGSTKLDLMTERDGLQAELDRPLQHMTCDTHLQLAHERALDGAE